MRTFRLVITLLLLYNASGTNLHPENKHAKDITIAAAADLVLAFDEIGKLFERTYGIRTKIIYSSSGTAREQIANGAPFDVYASANIKFVDDLIKAGKIIPDTQELYGIGRVGAATSVKSKLRISSLNDLLKSDYKKIAIADPSHAPYGLAAKQTLEKFGLWDKLKDKMIYAKDIQHSLSLLNTGNVEAAFISLSVVNTKKVNFYLAEDKLHAPLKQSIAVVKGTKKEVEARKFIRFVNGTEGRKIMIKYGFILPDGK